MPTSNVITDELQKILYNINVVSGHRSTEIICAKLEKADIWYASVGENCVHYLRKIHALEYLLTTPKSRKEYYEKHRQSIKPGKFLTKCGVYTYALGHSLAGKLSPPEIIEISGELLKWAYSEKSNDSKAGTLSSSCMRHAYMMPWMDLYVGNARMVIILEDTKVTARALLWDNVKLGTREFTLMDRVYGNPREVEQLLDYAKKKGYYRKEQQSYEYHDAVLGEDSFRLKGATVTLKKPFSPRAPLPYLDTFFTGRYENDLLVELQVDGSKPFYHIRTTNGCGDRYCTKCGKVIPMLLQTCPSCGTNYRDVVTVKCPICKQNFMSHYFREEHVDCVLKRKYICKDCGKTHIANSKEEFEAKTCKEEAWTTDGGMEPKMKPEIVSEELLTEE